MLEKKKKFKDFKEFTSVFKNHFFDTHILFGSPEEVEKHKKEFVSSINDYLNYFNKFNLITLDNNKESLSLYSKIFPNLKAFEKPSEIVFSLKKNNYDLLVLGLTSSKGELFHGFLRLKKVKYMKKYLLY